MKHYSRTFVPAIGIYASVVLASCSRNVEKGDSALMRVSLGSQAKPALYYGEDSARIEADSKAQGVKFVRAVVTAVYPALMSSPSISREDSAVELVLREGECIPAHDGVRRIMLRYNEALAPRKFRIGDEVKLEFCNDGRFYGIADLD